MTWKRFSQQQQRGAQLHARPGDAPKEAVKDRDAQQHELADMQVAQTDEPQRGIDYPATNPPDNTNSVHIPSGKIRHHNLRLPSRTMPLCSRSLPHSGQR